MADSALRALYLVLSSHLNAAASPVNLWGNRAKPLEEVEAGLEKPYSCFFWAGGGEERIAAPSTEEERLILTVKGVALDMKDALTMQQQITGLLRNSGSQDVDPRLPSNDDFDILTVTRDRVVWLVEKFEGAVDIYHAGHLYEFLMERK